jgi:hypothetical protein
MDNLCAIERKVFKSSFRRKSSGRTRPVVNSRLLRQLLPSTKLLTEYGTAGTRSHRFYQDLRQSPLPISTST